MTTYALKQIVVTDSMYNTINAGTDPALNKAYFDAGMGKIDAAMKMDLFSVVSLIEANDLNEVFEIGNIGPENKIKRFAQMSSVSVGNIIVDTETMKEYMVDKFGFTELK